MQKFLEEINQDGFEIGIQFHCVVLGALVDFFISIQGCFVELDDILGLEEGGGGMGSVGVGVLGGPGGHAGGLHLLLALGGDEVVVLG